VITRAVKGKQKFSTYINTYTLGFEKLEEFLAFFSERSFRFPVSPKNDIL
jgi:hypothetical protein